MFYLAFTECKPLRLGTLLDATLDLPWHLVNACVLELLLLARAFPYGLLNRSESGGWLRVGGMWVEKF